MKLLSFVLVLVFSAIGVAQNAQIEFPLILKDAAGDSAVLWFGVDPSGTDGIDKHLQEEELPPLPPSKVFDVRFIGDDINLPQIGLGSFRDIRRGDATFSGEVKHGIALQTTNNSRLTIYWDFPENITGNLVDLYGGTYLKKLMSGKGELSISLVTVVNRILMTVNYKAPSLTISSPNGGEVLRIYEDAAFEWTSNFVKGEVTLFLSRDNGATFENLAQAENTGSYVWTVAGAPSDACLLKITDATGAVIDHSDATFSIQHITEATSAVQPTNFEVSPNYPNPFNPQTTIEFYAPFAAPIKAEIINAAGQYVRTLTDQVFSAGKHALIWNGLDDSGKKAAGGIYFYRIRFGENQHIGKMMLMP